MYGVKEQRLENGALQDLAPQQSIRRAVLNELAQEDVADRRVLVGLLRLELLIRAAQDVVNAGFERFIERVFDSFASFACEAHLLLFGDLAAGAAGVQGLDPHDSPRAGVDRKREEFAS